MIYDVSFDVSNMISAAFDHINVALKMCLLGELWWATLVHMLIDFDDFTHMLTV